MADLLDRFGRASGGWLVGLGLGCAALGILAGVNPSYGFAAALGVAFVAIVLGDTAVGLILFTVLSFLDVLRSGGASASFMKVAGLLLFVSWLASTATRRRRSGTSLIEANPTLVAAGAALVVWSAMSILWAEKGGNAVTDTYRFMLDFLLIPIVFGSVRRREQVMWLAGAFVLGAVISAVYGFIHPVSSTVPGAQNGRLAGTVGDANDQAAVLVGAIALAFGLVAATKRTPLLRLLAITALLVSLAGVVNTLSRSGLVALGAMMIAGVVFGGRWRGWAALLLVLAAVGTVGYFVALAPVTARARVTSADTSGRSTIWKVGWRMAQANPWLGVGSGNFQISSIHYLQAPGAVTRADLIVDTPKVAHNIYLEVLADLGVPGLLAFLTLVVASAAAALRAAKAFQAAGNDDLELMSRCVILALVGFMVSDFFLSGQFSKQLWLVLALGPTLLAIARARARGDGDDEAASSWTQHPNRIRRLRGVPA